MTVFCSSKFTQAILSSEKSNSRVIQKHNSLVSCDMLAFLQIFFGSRSLLALPIPNRMYNFRVQSLIPT